MIYTTEKILRRGRFAAIFLALYILAFSLGFVVLTLGIVSHQRTGNPAYRYFTLLFIGVIIYLVGDTFDIYERFSPGCLGGSCRISRWSFRHRATASSGT